MVIDKLCTFCTDQAVTATAAGTDVYDREAVGVPTVGVGAMGGVGVDDVVAGRQLYANFLITTAFSAGTIAFSFESSAAADLSSAKVHATTPAIAFASGGLAAGKLYSLPVSLARPSLRYLGVRHTASVTGVAGKVTAWLSHEQPPSNIGVSPA